MGWEEASKEEEKEMNSQTFAFIILCAAYVGVLTIIIGRQLKTIIELLDDLVDRTPLDHVDFIGSRRRR